MCRLVGIVASVATEFGLVLKEAPRSLALLSKEHPDGWGIAIFGHEGSEDASWQVHKGTERAAEDFRFHELAARSKGHVLVAHIRQKTVGPTKLDNTHPFTRSGWVFAHNGTVKDLARLRAGSSPERLAEITGDTDSELLFAFLLTHLDARGITQTSTPEARDEATRVLASATAELRAREVGAFNFLLSNGDSSFVHRFGRSLFVLERSPHHPIIAQRERWTARRHAVLVASERITEEPWVEVAEGTLLRIDRVPTPRIEWPADDTRKAS